jgi:hypothetical protein
MRISTAISPNKLFFVIALLMIGLLSFNAHANCSATFCSVNTEWDIQGVWADSGGRFDLRYEFINQNQLRSGSSAVSPLRIDGVIDEIKTRNQNVLATWDYNLTPALGFTFSLPLARREHTHIANDPAGAVTEQWNYTRLGDVRLLGRYQIAPLGSSGNVGAIFGITLPTGQINISNDAGQLAERSLQPGSGTTDLVLGGFYRYSVPAAKTSWFTQLQLQSALNERDHFKPGRKLNLDAGYLRQVAKDLGLMLQLNYSVKQRDRDDNAEPDESGSRVLAISPGVSYLWGRDWQIYSFVQKPLYQNVNGVQLSSDWSLVLGLTTKF